MTKTTPVPTPLTQLQHPPFGTDAAGQLIQNVSGYVVAGAVRYMLDVVAQRYRQQATQTPSQADITAIQNAALDTLVTRLNAVMPSERYQVTADYLLNTVNRYSTEFWLFVADYCREICGDEDFYYNHASYIFPEHIIQLGKPLTSQQVFSMVPRISGWFNTMDVSVPETHPTWALVRWYPRENAKDVPPEHHPYYLKAVADTYVGTLATIPTWHEKMPPAQARLLRRYPEDGEYFEWRFSWQNPPQQVDGLLYVSLAASVAVLLWLLLRGPGFEIVGLLAAGVPLLLGWLRYREAKLQRAVSQQQQLVAEQNALAQDQLDRYESTSSELAHINLNLAEQNRKLSIMHEVVNALGSTWDFDELLDKTLNAVVQHMNFDRALLMIYDESKRMLTQGRSVGEDRRLDHILRNIKISVDDTSTTFVRIFHAERPVLVDVNLMDATLVDRYMAERLNARHLLGVPLISQGWRVGILAVDNGPSERPLTKEQGDLLYTVGNQIAAAVEGARLYQHIQEQNRTLEQRVQARTAELKAAMQQAEEARQSAEEANESKSLFLANVSHELRTPLTAVFAFTKLSKNRFDDIVQPIIETDDKTVRKAVQQISDNLQIVLVESQRLTDLINDVLDLAKIESGHVEWHYVFKSPAELIDHAMNATSALYAEKGLPLHQDIPDELPEVFVDPARIVQVVINLLSNAVKFTEAGSVTVRAVADEAQVTISVMDTGIGIAPKDQQVAFLKFKQVGDVLTDKPKGTGLGLAICKEIVEHHGGRIWVESEVGQGATFAFTIPLQPVVSNQPKTQTSEVAAVP